jgi:hypothetical protein
MKKRCAVAILFCSVVFVGCTDANLQKVANSMLALSKAVSQVQTDVIAANTAKVLDDQTTGTILAVCTKVNVAGQQVNAVIRSISTLDPASRSTLVNLLTPISQALDPTKIDFVLGIKDPATQQEINGGFILMRSSVSAIQLVLASGG